MLFPILPVRQSHAGPLRLCAVALFFGLLAASGRSEEKPQRAALHFEPVGLPRIGRSDTVISFQAKRLGPVPAPVMVTIFNESDVGVLQWNIFEDRSWLSTSPNTATANETDVLIWIVNTNAPLGHHTGRLMIESENAVNTPETIWVELDMICPVQISGDVNQDDRLSQADIIFLVNHVLRGGPLPRPVWQAGDVNCDETLTQSDIIVLVNHLLRAGPSPCNVCQFF